MTKMLISIVAAVAIIPGPGFAADTRCSDERVVEYIMKRECLLDVNPESCNQMALKGSKLGAGGKIATVGVGGLLGVTAAWSLYEKFFDSKALPKIEKTTSAIDSIHERFANYRSIVTNSLASNAKAAKFQGISSYDELEQQARTRNDLDPELRMIKSATQLEVDMTLEKTQDEFLKKLKKSGLAEAANYRVLRDEIYRVLEEQFPSEFKSIKPLLDKINTLRDGFVNAESLTGEEFIKATNELYTADAKLEKLVAGSSPVSQMVSSIAQQAPVAGNIYRQDYITKVRNAVDSVYNKSDRMQKLFPKLAVGSLWAGIGLGAATVAAQEGLEVLDIHESSKEIKNCREQLKLNDTEVKILTGGSNPLIKTATLPNPTGLCKHIRLADPLKTIAEIKKANKNEIPIGTCNMIMNDSDALDSIFQEAPSFSSASCGRVSAPDLKLIGLGTDTQFVYVGESFNLKAPFNPTFKWPDLAEGEVLNQFGVVDNFKTEDLKKKYPPTSHINGNTQPDFSQRDTKAYFDNCTHKPTKKASPVDCDLLRAAFMSRIAYSIGAPLCIVAKGASDGGQRKEKVK